MSEVPQGRLADHITSGIGNGRNYRRIDNTNVAGRVDSLTFSNEGGTPYAAIVYDIALGGAAFSPDDTQIVAITDDGRVILLDLN